MFEIMYDCNENLTVKKIEIFCLNFVNYNTMITVRNYYLTILFLMRFVAF